MTDKTSQATEQAVAEAPRKRAAKRTASASATPVVKTVVTAVTTGRKPRAAKTPAPATDPVSAARWQELLGENLPEGAVQVTAAEAARYCTALTDREHASGYLTAIQDYRPAVAKDFEAAGRPVPELSMPTVEVQRRVSKVRAGRPCWAARAGRLVLGGPCRGAYLGGPGVRGWRGRRRRGGWRR